MNQFINEISTTNYSADFLVIITRIYKGISNKDILSRCDLNKDITIIEDYKNYKEVD